MALPTQCCCGCSLQTGTKIIAIIGIIVTSFTVYWYLFGILFVGAALAVYSSQDDDARRKIFRDEIDIDSLGVAITVVTVGFLIFHAMYCILCVMLLIGANRRELNKCRIWYKGAIFYTVIWALNAFVESTLLGSKFGVESALWNIFHSLVALAILWYQLRIVKAFMEEIKAGGPIRTAGIIHQQAHFGFAKPPHAIVIQGNGMQPPSYEQATGVGGAFVNVPLGDSTPHPGFIYPRVDDGRNLHI